MEELMELIGRFISGNDISISAANKIEVLLADNFVDDETLQDFSITLSMYRPGGGDLLYDYDYVRSKMILIEKYMQNKYKLR
ncbi:hypothetical protein [Mesorhizobium sp. GbtcB19]|uniref:hypothetical protein n=1 Tax=Mesorhizobium sp. GbtcB19 TaxID=2824764 RepID=UPI001C2F4B44|nr:hypothetical protein [Mesorhizobium sp. GbtcB19]